MQERTHKVPISASQAVPSTMQLALPAIRGTPHGASRLEHAMSGRLKPDVLRPGIVAMQRSMVLLTAAMHDAMTTPLRPRLISFTVTTGGCEVVCVR